MYTCNACGRDFSDKDIQLSLSGGSVRCSYCGSKVMFKKTPPVARVVKAV